MIEINNITKSFDENQVLGGVSASFEKGKVNFIIGRSGSGKSVITKCIVGLHEVDSGEVLFDGRDFTHMNRRRRKEIRKEIGMLFQGSALFDSLTVEENVMFPLSMFTRTSTEEMRDRANFCLERVQLEGKNHLYPAELSGGMMKRVGIARAIAMNPKYLFADEPNSGLDPQTAIVIDNLIKEITYEFDITTVVISHDMNSVMEAGDNIHFIHEGKIWWSGDRTQILRSGNQQLDEFVYASKFMKQVRYNLAK